MRGELSCGFVGDEERELAGEVGWGISSIKSVAKKGVSVAKKTTKVATKVATKAPGVKAVAKVAADIPATHRAVALRPDAAAMLDAIGELLDRIAPG